MNKPKIAFLTLLITLLIAAGVVAYYHYTLPTSGVITHKNLQATPDTISWGLVTPDTQVTRNVTLENIGTVLLTLNMTTANATGLTSYTVTWNLEAATLAPTAKATASFTLTVHSWATTEFSFDIIIGEKP